MRALSLSVMLASSLSFAQRPPDAGAPSGTGYSVVTSTARPAAAPAAPPPATAAGTSNLTVVSARVGPQPAQPAAVSAPSRGPRGPSEEVARGSGVARVGAEGVVYSVGPRGVVTATPAVQDPDAGVDDPSVPTAGALFGGPLPGPSIGYMGQPVNTRRPAVAPPLAPGAVRPDHALPGSVGAPPGGAAPWIPHSTSGFQLGPRGASTGTSGYGFQLPSGQRANPGTLRNAP